MDNINQQSVFSQYHTHNGADGTPFLDEKNSIINTRKFIIQRCVSNLSDNSVASTIGGYLVIPFNGYINEIGATVDTAGTTGTMTIDVLNNGTSIFDTKITIDSGETTSRTGATQNSIKQNYKNFSVGDRISIDVTAIQTTPAKGLSVFLNVVKTS